MAGSFYDKLVTSDWLGRSEDEYTYAKKGISIGWEESLAKGEAFSTFILNVEAKKKHLDHPKQIYLAKQACTSIMNRMLVKTGKKSTISFTEDFDNYAQGDKIVVTLEPLKQDNAIKFPSYNHALDPIIGYTVHEIAHILYTDSEYGNYVMKFKGVEAHFKSMIMNVLEDERIEKLVAENYRGYTNYVGKAKDYCFGKKFQDELIKSNNRDSEDPVNRLCEVFIHFLRYPKALRENHVNEFEAEILQFQKILTPYPETITQLTVVTEEIYQVFFKFFKQQKNGGGAGDDQEEQEQQEQQSKAKAQSGGGNVDSDKGDAKKVKGQSGESGDEDGDGSGEGESGESDDEGTGMEVKIQVAGKSGGDAGEGQGQPMASDDELTEELAELLSTIIEAMEKSQPMTGTAEEVANTIFKGAYGVEVALKSISSFNNDAMSKRDSDTHIYPELRNLQSSEMQVYFEDAKNLHTSSNHYDRALNEVRSYASSLRSELQKMNRNIEVTNTGLFEGNFDDGLLVDALIGAKNVYSETFKVTNQGVCIGLLGDESGSMDYKNAWQLWMQIAVMFERALDGVNKIDFFCYGHTTGFDPMMRSDTTLINTYFEGRKKGDRRNLGKIYHHNTNRDGHAIVETVARIKKQIAKDMPLVLFVISDGEPSASVPNGYTQRAYVKKVVDTIEKDMNTTIIHIAIHPNIPSKEMFNNYVSFTNFSTLVKDVGNLLKKIVTARQSPITV